MKTLTELDCLNCAGTGYYEHTHNKPETCKKCNGDGLNRDITAKDIANYFVMNRFNNDKHTTTEMYGIMVDIINVLSVKMLAKGYEEGIRYALDKIAKSGEDNAPSYEIEELIKIMIPND